MKVLLLDLAHPLFTWKVDDKTKQKWVRLEQRLSDVWGFLQTTFFTDHGKKTRLTSLPWILLIGPHRAGKTTLLSNAPIKYILQKKTTDAPSSEENKAVCFATKHAIFVEAEGNDLGFSLLHDGNRAERLQHDTTWRYFLYWLKKKQRRVPLQAVYLMLPYRLFTFSEKMRKYAVKRLSERLSAMEILPGKIPLYIVVTQCDRMNGFVPFFHGLPQEESEQLFGIQLAKNSSYDALLYDVKEQCERLIRQINQQLIYKLHHENNADIKPYIKEFPLQLEQLKRNILDVLKRLQPALAQFSVGGVFFTSATQEAAKEVLASHGDSTASTAVTIYNSSLFAERTYFVKSLFTQLPSSLQKMAKQVIPKWHEKIRLQYVLPAIMLIFISSIFVNDFMHGMAVERAAQTATMLAMQEKNVHITHADQLRKVFAHLEALKKLEKEEKLTISYRFFSFYTKRALLHVQQLYLKSVDILLLPVLQQTLDNALSLYNNYELHVVYSTLKAYLMLTNEVKPDTAYLQQALLMVEPFHSHALFATHLKEHVAHAFQSDDRSRLPIDLNLVQTVRQYLWSLSKERLAYIILFNDDHYYVPMPLPWQKSNKNVLLLDQDFYIPSLFSAANLTNILTRDAIYVAKEALVGNQVLGLQQGQPIYEQDALLISNVRNIYIQAYANYWEKLLTHMAMRTTNNLIDWEKQALFFTQSDSLFMQFLQFVYDNTYFEPIISMSPKLKSLSALLDKNQTTFQQLAAIQHSLEGVYNYVRPVLLSDDRAKSAFELTAKRMQNQNDPLTQLRLVADHSPEPIKTWLQQLANQLWAHLIQEASQYINVAWQEKIGRFFLTHFSNRYPFDVDAKEEVALDKFKGFFGTHGHFIKFYQQYLDPFIDYEEKTWRWKTLDGVHLAFSDDVLKQTQLGLRIHDAFFPNGGDDISVQFSLAARQWGGELKQVVITIHNQKIIDSPGKKSKHLLEWPGQSLAANSSVQFTLLDQKKLQRQYMGEWSLFRLIDDSFDAVLSKNELLLDLSPDDYPAKYVIETKEPVSPFSTVKLAYFRIPEKLIV